MPEPDTPGAGPGVVLRSPADDVLDTTGIGHYVRWLAAERGLTFTDYEQLWAWSVRDLDGFWSSIWDHFGVRGNYDTVLGTREMPGARWFPGAELNYVEHMLGGPEDADRTAVIAHSQTREPRQLTFGELADQVARARAGLQRLGVTRGDRVAGYLPNIPETLVAFLACASLGAIWASCAPEFGARSVIDRFAQIEPTVLITVGGYTYGSKDIDKTADVAAIRAALPTVEHVVGITYGPFADPGTTSWGELTVEPGPLQFDSVPFDHPLYVLFSSGTTGLPKAIVHGHGGILLEHLKAHALGLDTRPGDRVLWFTTTAWMMWNLLVSGLLHRAAIVLVDGNPAHPDLLEQWRIAASTRATLFGTSPGYLMACRDAGIDPARDLDLTALRTLGVTGAPLPDTGFDWIQQRLGPEVLVNSVSGGTDICSGFIGGNPWLPVYRGELAGPCLGVDATALDPDGHEIVDALGELVIRRPMPSMPVRFWNDPDDKRYRSAYFDTYPGLWRHGDWVTMTRRRSFVISGRSDATLNRGGVRLGTAEFYNVVEELPEITDSLVIHLEDTDGGPGRLLLYVALLDRTELDDDLRNHIRRALRQHLSPRHVPDVVEAVPAIPRTLTGKKLETPIKQILRGRPVTEVVSPDATDNYDALTAFTAPAGGDRATCP
ncbi:acetoacetate--CoA ligase [Pseudonocardia endophytica]|uniref:Acetoacetyl-CoA synthetase n=1 Tax=Pseudonocardia endophytica TaxID=401976 RepID=A0A4R1I4R4_PSEEN|nr:acetoacetate--CoA ligase [Pseudonocardia endophytica]TCK27579.1 acetoacetyl-CoA synthetase [Pseudonocardia endophytica]